MEAFISTQLEYVDGGQIAPEVLLAPEEGVRCNPISAARRFASLSYPVGLPGRLCNGRIAVCFMDLVPMILLAFFAAVLSAVISICLAFLWF